MEKRKQIIIKNPIFINPFAWYALFWMLVFSLYAISPSKLNVALDFGLVVFLLITIGTSTIFAFHFNQLFKNESFFVKNEKSSFSSIALMVVLYALDFLYSGNIPLLAALFGFDSGYQDFGIPTLHVIIVTFSVFFAIKNGYIFVLFRNKMNLFKFLVPLMYFIMVFSRGMLLLIFFCTGVLLLCQIKISIKRLVYALVVIVVVMWVFGIAGNIRVSNQWNNSSLILLISQIDVDPYNIFAPFYWGEEYIICSIRNLNNTMINILPTYDFGNLVYTLIPDFVAKRIWPDTNIVVDRVVEVFTTTTTYSYSYSSFGYLGMLIEFLLYMLTGVYLQKTKYMDSISKIVTLSIASFIFGLSIFDSMLQYSGYSFAIMWGLLLGKSRLDFRGSGIKLVYTRSSRRVVSDEKV